MKPVPDRIRNGLWLFLLAIVAGGPTPAVAQIESSAVALQLDPSARSSAMGHTGAAIFWGAFPEFYWNPALLGHHRGIHFESSNTQLVPNLADDVFIRANRLTLGAWGFGATLSGQPISAAGGTTLDYGETIVTDNNGQVIGTFEPFEEVDTWAIGVNGIELVENLLAGGSEGHHSISRFGDLSWGFASKDVELVFASATGRTTTHDHGILARLTPYDSIDHEGLWPGLDRSIDPVGLRVDLSYGRAWINDGEETIDFTNGESSPVVRLKQQGIGVRAALGFKRTHDGELDLGDTSWLLSALSPIVQVSLAWDGQQETYGEAEGWELWSNGVEITVLNILSIRRGSYETWTNIPPVQVDRSTSGYGLGFHVPGLGGVYYDHATVEVPASTLDDHKPSAFGFWVDPRGLWREFQ